MIRLAIPSDKDFITRCIIESEKSGSEIFPYSAILGLTKNEFKQGIIEIFDEEIPNQPWTLDHWLIYEIDGKAAAGLCYWVEQGGMKSSEMLKSQMLSYQFSNHWEASKEKLTLVSSINIPRKKGYTQLEHLYTHPNYRGKGLMKQLINWVFNQSKNITSNRGFEIQLLKSNSAALSLYEYMGFIVESTQCEPEVERLTLLSSDCKVQMIKQHG